MENFWQACSHKLEQELTPQQYSAWIKPLVPLDFEDGLLRIAAPNRFKLDWVKTQFANRITALACEYWDAPTEVQFVLDPRGNQGRRPAANAQANGGGASGLGLPNHEQLHLDPEPAQPVRAVAPRQEQSRINPVLTFDNLVTGKANQLARAAPPGGQQPRHLLQPAVPVRRRGPG
jgi:chromosomal replication initiator protein